MAAMLFRPQCVNWNAVMSIRSAAGSPRYVPAFGVNAMHDNALAPKVASASAGMMLAL